MIVVIIAGGSGTRLWPLSTPTNPKHLLRINGDDKSLLQRTYERAKKLTDHIYIVSEASHSAKVREQLSHLPEEAFIIEPARRGTANCIIAALCHFGTRHSGDEPIAFLSADHYVRDTEGFVHSFRIAEEISKNENRMLLIGVEPTYPATGFGYIQKGSVLDEHTFAYNVKSFKEKPDYRIASKYFSSANYLWNCGYFVASINVFKDTMKKHAPKLLKNYEKLASAKGDPYTETYLSFGHDTIDYALIEHVTNLLVIPANFDWMDLGSFNDLHRAVKNDEAGNHLHGASVKILEVENSLIENHEGKPVAVIGLDNIVVINTKEGLLVARKDLSQKVGEISKSIKLE